MGNIEGFECKLSKVESLEAYFAQEYGPAGECRPCRLKPLASLYLGVLEKAGEAQHAQHLTEVFDGGDILEIAKAMDGIKQGAKDGVRQDLRDLDCLAQTFEDEGESEEVGDEAV